MNRATSASGFAYVTATSCLTHRGENDRTAPGKPWLTALTGHTATPRPAAASWGAAAVTDVHERRTVQVFKADSRLVAQHVAAGCRQNDLFLGDRGDRESASLQPDPHKYKNVGGRSSAGWWPPSSPTATSGGSEPRTGAPSTLYD